MWSTVLVIGIGAIVIASIMETIKYKKYEDKITKKQATLWAILFSVLLTPVLYYGFTLLGKPLVMILYAVILFLLQKELNMEAIRPIVKKIVAKKIDQL